MSSPSAPPELPRSSRLSARRSARQAIRAWVKTFFGCAECARHFGQYYDAHDGAGTRGHIETSLWLWRAHNAVSLRLRETDPDAAPYKKLWPNVASCKECYRTPPPHPPPTSHRHPPPLELHSPP